MKKSSVNLTWLLAVILAVLFVSLASTPAAGTNERRAHLPAPLTTITGEPGKPVVRFILFYSDTCPHCHEIMENYLPTVYEKYGSQVEYRYIDIHNNTDNYLTMLGLEKKLGLPEDRRGYVPALIVGDQVLVGGNEIPNNLEGYIDEYLAQGGVDFPALDDLPEVVLPTPEPAVQILIFFDPNHADFEAFRAFIASLGQEHGAALEAYGLDVSQSEFADALAQINDWLGIVSPPPGTPQILIDRQMLVSLEKIQQQLPGLIEQYLAQGGVNLPWDELSSLTPSETPTPEPQATEPAPKPIYLAYFEQAGCQECARTSYDLSAVQERYPQLVVETFSIEENAALNEWLSQKYGVPQEKRLSTPMIFIGQDVLLGAEANLDNLMTVVAQYASSGAERTWDDFDQTEAEKNLIDRFRSFGLLTVLGAGLIDGLNPCAFATLIFFISYLTFTGRRGRDVLFVGVSFALGVFLTYLLVGVGLLRVVQSLSFFTDLGRWVYLVTALLCALLAILTFRDFFKARRGQVGEMALSLPLALRRRIHQVIRESAQMRAFVAVAFFTGFVVSLLELACTGQVYLPTIMFVISVPELAARAFFYLLLYCLMFILPLVVVFVLSYFGTTSEQLGRFVNRHTSTLKLLTGLVFVGLALWMTWTLAPLFGAHAPWNWVLLIIVVAVIALSVVILRFFEKSPPQKKRSRRRKSPA
jgi:cytochrome c biogenesis protein CcdA/glutaredoxin